MTQVTWIQGDSATIWVDFDLARKILADKPMIVMGRSASALRFNLGKKFKSWPMKLTGIPAEINVENLQK